MKLNQRQREVLQHVQRDGYATIEMLADLHEVTQQTIRRDINTLCEYGLLSRYHGGATLPQSSVENISYSTRQTLNLEAKQRIARMVAEHIPDNASLFINIGTTTEEVAKILRNHKGLRVITNNLNVANIMCDIPTCELIIAGGLVRKSDMGITGEAAMDFINQFKVDYGVIGISGIDSDGTLLDYDYREVRVAQVIMANSRSVLLVADHSKFHRNAMVRLGTLSQISAFYTDENVPEGFESVVASSGVELHIAP